LVEAKPVVQVGILVKDVKETAKKFEEILGIGPFEILESPFRDKMLYGEPEDFKIIVGLAKSGGIQVELMEIISGNTIYHEQLKKKGYGLHHIAIGTSDMEETQQEMKKKGFAVTQSGNRRGVKFAYLNTEDELGVIVEIIERDWSFLRKP
jgi:catechol 2,3-dioxygenase-like lactoylglutathione lyase family enzyme